MSRAQSFLLLIVIGCVSWLAFSLIDFNANPLDLLPKDLPQVQVIRDYEERFASQNDIIIALENPDADALKVAADSFVESMEKRGDLFAKLSARAPWEEDASQMGELLAYLWFNGPPEELTALEERLRVPAVTARLEKSFDVLANSMDVAAITKASNDPAGLTDIGGEHTPRIEGASRVRFRSPAGDLQVVLVQPKAPLESQRDVTLWQDRVEEAIAAWRAREPELSRATEVLLTGRTIYVTEVTKALRRDLAVSVLITLAFIIAVFWLLHRRLRPLLWLLTCLYITFILTILTGRLFYSELSAMSIGFAAILMGLTVDYGFIIYQESKNSHRDPRALRPIFRHTIGWAALTTACVFFALNLSSLRGASQLGTMVAIGISVGAVIMVGLYVHLLSTIRPSLWANRAPMLIPVSIPTDRRTPLWLLVSLLFGGGATVWLAYAGMPSFSSDASSIRPTKDHPALETFLQIQEKLGGQPVTVMVSAPDDAGMVRALDATARVLNRHEAIAGFTLPDKLWPNLEHQTANAGTLRRLTALEAPLLEAGENIGLSEDSFALTRKTFATWRRMLSSPLPYELEDPASLWLTDRMIINETDRKQAIGFVRLEESEGRLMPDPIREELEAAGARPVGLGYLSPALVQIMQHEKSHVILPTACLLMAMLLIVFRSLRGVLLALVTLGFSALILTGTMRLFRIDWNVFNLAAIPILLGIGLDYTIHVILALRRTRGDIREVQQNVGKALLLCGATTAVGFGSLKWTEHGGLPSLGVVCAIGVLATMLTAVFLLPHWWRFAHRHVLR